jgi:tetratricopeptide (TPR) repeat protein
MKKMFLSLFVCILLFDVTSSGTLHIELSADLVANDVKSRIFQSELLISEGEEHEIFTGPYTIGLFFNEVESGQYDFDAKLYGLGPQYFISDYEFKLKTSEKMLIPSLPVKDDVIVNYIVTLVDDTSSAFSTEYSLRDSSLWGVSETIHYRTHWVKGSLIDFMWNEVMGYLEFIYNKYRESYRLSESKKIDTYIHPEPTNEIFMDENNHYSIQPKSLRIDLVYGHNIKAATPAPACELLMYRQWGYGPRWMVTGLADYYDDNMLEIRDYIGNYDNVALLELLKDENKVRGDTGSVIAGALVFWLLQNESFTEFKKLYTLTTALDFDKKFKMVYEYSFDELLDRFLNYARNYRPAEGELDYYASFYFGQGNMYKAKKYYEELSVSGEGDRIANLKKLATCEFWLGNFAAADTIYDLLPKLGDNSAETIFMKGDVKLARGDIDEAVVRYVDSFEKGFSTGGLRLVSILIDRGDIDSAGVLLKNMEDKARRLLDYSIETAEVKIINGENADSLLDPAIGRAINRSNKTPHDPRPYMILGKAYALKDDYEKSIYYFNTAYFLEISLFNQSMILLEMGKTEDLLGNRHKALEFYRRVIESGGGEYQKNLATRYLNTAYRRR